MQVFVKGRAELNNFGFHHFAQQIVAFAGAFANPGKDRETVARLCDVVDKFHDKHGLANARAPEQADFAAAQEGLNQVNNLDARLEHLFFGRLFGKSRRVAVNRHPRFRINGAKLVHRVTNHVHHAAQRRFAYRHGNRAAGVNRFHTAHHAVSGQHRNCAGAAFAQVLLHFGDNINRLRHVVTFRRDTQCLVNRRQVTALELNVHDRADDLHHAPDMMPIASG